MRSEAVNPWRALLHERLRGQPTPMLVMPDTLWSAASLWAGTRAWVTAFRAAGLVAGDRLVCGLPEGPAFVQVLLACLWEEITFAPIDPRHDVETATTDLEARVVVATSRDVVAAGVGVFVPDAAAQPPALSPALRAVRASAADGAALLLTAGDVHAARAWTAWSNHRLVAAIDDHHSLRPLDGARVLSVQPWHCACGLIAGLLPALLHADEIVRERSGGRDAAAVASAAREHQVTHLDAVPGLLLMLPGHPGLCGAFHGVPEVITGGAVATAELTAALRRSGWS